MVLGRREILAKTKISFIEDTFVIELMNRRTLSIPLDWYPRLVHATQEERDNWELYSEVEHIHREDLEEDISVEGLLAGQRSRESEASFKRWLEARQAGRGVLLYELRDMGFEEIR